MTEPENKDLKDEAEDKAAEVTDSPKSIAEDLKSDDHESKTSETTKDEPKEEPELGERKDSEDVAGQTSEDAERIATSKQVELDGQAGEQTTLLPSPMHLDIPPSATDPSELGHGPDSPTTSLIQSLRDQLTQLHDQSQQLNSKLVASISRHADLEDNHVHLQQQHKELQERSELLEGEKRKWEDSMNTGLLVERSQIKDEMQKLAAGLVEEERRRGSAEERRMKVESEVDDLAASLFDQANTMVAVERIHRTNAETRLKETEENLAAAESAIRDMQLHLQSLPSSANPQMASPPPSASVSRRLLGSHLPYTEFITFLSHLRALRPLRETPKDMFPVPIITNLVAQPFIARAITEDQDPTLRLDAAPNISYFSRRTVSNAAIAGDLIIEPVSVNTLLSGSASMHDLSCALCGSAVFAASTPGQPQSPSGSQFGPPPNHPTHRSSSRFSLKPFFATPSPTAAAGQGAAPQSPGGSPMRSAPLTVHVFRIAKPTPAPGAAEEKIKYYPLCKNGWCLQRLRATCELWYFVRMGIIHAVWHGDDGYSTLEQPLPIDRRASSPAEIHDDSQTAERKKSTGWGLGFKLSEKSSWRGAFRSGSASGPSSPGLPVEEKGKGLEHETGEGVKELDPALQLEQPRPQPPLPPRPVSMDKEGHVAPVIPSITQQEASPIKRAPGSADDSEAGDENIPVEDAELSRKDSNLSATSRAETDDGFHTPGNDDDSPEEVASVKKDGDGDEADSKDAEEGPQTPRKSTDEAMLSSDRSVSPRPKGPRAPPRRNKRLSQNSATLSPRTSRDLGSEAGSSTSALEDDADAAGPGEKDITRDTVDGTAAKDDEGEKEDTKQNSQAPEKEEETNGGNGAIDLSDDPVKSPSAPPRLPPRLPARKPQRASQDATAFLTAGNEGQWLDPNSQVWEVKTWKMVVKLKEDMWKARVGVEQV